MLRMPEVALGWGRAECVQGKWEASAVPALLSIFGRPALALEPGAVSLK